MDSGQIERLLEKARSADLAGLGFLAQFDLATLAREYNGIGPEWAGAAIRSKVTDKLAMFEPAALIHDLRNYKSNGTRLNFNVANTEFALNCLKLADHAYPWYSWRRYRARAIAHVLFDFVNGAGGWKAWQDCFNRNQNKE